MKCKINTNLQCHEQIKTGRGKWDLLKDCTNCEVTLKTGQYPLIVPLVVGEKNKLIMYKEVNIMTKKEKSLWIKSKLKKIEDERKAAFKEKGYEDLFIFPQGETQITIDTTKAPREIKTRRGLRDVYRIIHNNKPYDLMINPITTLSELVLKMLMLGQDTFTVVRVGTAKDTRYTIKEYEELKDQLPEA